MKRGGHGKIFVNHKCQLHDQKPDCKYRSNFLDWQFPSNHGVEIETSVRFPAWQKFVLLRGRTTASLNFGMPWQDSVDLKITWRTCLGELWRQIFSQFKINKNLPGASGPILTARIYLVNRNLRGFSRCVKEEAQFEDTTGLHWLFSRSHNTSCLTPKNFT